MKWYTIYDNATDDVVAYGTSKDCARAMGMSPSVFKTTLHRARTGKNNKYFVLEEPFKGFEE